MDRGFNMVQRSLTCRVNNRMGATTLRNHRFKDHKVVVWGESFFYRLLVDEKIGCLGPGPGWRLGSLAKGVSRPTPRGRVGGLAGGCLVPHPGWFGCLAGAGVSRPTSEGVSQHALRQTPPLPPPPPADGYCSYWNAFLWMTDFADRLGTLWIRQISRATKFRRRRRRRLTMATESAADKMQGETQ